MSRFQVAWLQARGVRKSGQLKQVSLSHPAGSLALRRLRSWAARGGWVQGSVNLKGEPDQFVTPGGA